MKLVVDPRALLGALDACAQVTPTKTTLPVLQSALLEIGIDGRLRVYATDLTLRIQHDIPATVDVAGSVLVPAGLAARWLDEVGDLGQLELELGADRLHWRCGPYQLRTTFMNVDDYPDVYSPTLSGPELLVDSEALASVIPSLLAVAHAHDDRVVHLASQGQDVTFYAVNDRHAAVAVLPNHGDTRAIPPPWTEWRIATRALSALGVSKGGSECTRIAMDASGTHVVLARPGVTVVAVPHSTAKPVPAIADIAAALIENGPRMRDSLDLERRVLLDLIDAGALLHSQATLLYEPAQQQLEMRARRDDERLQGDTWATAAVLRGPRHRLGVTLECGAVQRLVKSLPGATLGLDLGDVLGGPGVRLWPVEELPDGARVVLVMRAAAGAQVHAEQEKEHVDAAA